MSTASHPEILDVIPVPELRKPITLEVIPVKRPGRQPRPKTALGWVWWFLCCIGWVWEWIFGAVSLIVGLSVLAAIPILQFLSLGYLLEASGSVARTGRLRDGFPGVRIAARIGSIVLGVGLLSLVPWVLSSMSQSAHIIDPHSAVAYRWRVGLIVTTAILSVHVVTAICCGGKLRYFLIPLLGLVTLIFRMRKPTFVKDSIDATRQFALSLRLWHYFWLGLRGFAGAMIWLAPPITLLALGRKFPLIGFIGALMLAIVLLYVPIVQVRFATHKRFSEFFQFWEARRTYQRAPWTFTIAFIVTLAFALPLYLLKIEYIPRELMGLESFVFILFMFPARLLMGWAYGFAMRCPKPRRHWFFRWTGWVWLPPVVAFYVLIVFFTQYTSWEGIWSLYEQHAFLLPAPFLGF